MVVDKNPIKNQGSGEIGVHLLSRVGHTVVKKKKTPVSLLKANRLSGTLSS